MGRRRRRRPNAIRTAANITAGAVAGGALQTTSHAFLPGVRTVPTGIFAIQGTIGGAALTLDQLERLKKKRR